jgi:HEPN domain-containing protein
MRRPFHPDSGTKVSNSAQYDRNAAFQTVNACFGLAGRVFSRVPDDGNEAAKFAYNNLGEIFAAATNLAVSIELYLKSLAIATEAPVLKTQNLLDLFDCLPQVLRESIELRFRVQMQWLVKQESSAALSVAITSTPTPPPMK